MMGVRRQRRTCGGKKMCICRGGQLRKTRSRETCSDWRFPALQRKALYLTSDEPRGHRELAHAVCASTNCSRTVMKEGTAKYEEPHDCPALNASPASNATQSQTLCPALGAAIWVFNSPQLPPKWLVTSYRCIISSHSLCISYLRIGSQSAGDLLFRTLPIEIAR